METIVEMLGGKLLSYGVSGFALLMIGFTYYLMKTELKRNEPRSIALKTIWMFMGLVILSTIVVGFFSLPIANKNAELKDEVNELSVGISEMINRLSKYEFAINELAYQLEKKNSTNPPKKPPTLDGKFTLDTSLLSKYVDFSKIKFPETYEAKQLDDVTREKLKKDVRDRLEINQFMLEPEQ